MASGKSIIVLTPNGRRQTVKVTPNTTILQVLEEVCKKQGFKSDEYDLKHHRNIMDISTTILFSGLPNNATLEMVAAQKQRTESSVTIGIQLENGNRLTGNFNPDDNLMHIIQQICPEESGPNKNVVIIYMRQELYGDSTLSSTTLRSLGLTGGRAMLRLLHRTPEELKTQANVSAPLPTKPAEVKPYVRKFHKIEDPDVNASVSYENQNKYIKKESPNPPQNSNFVTDFIKKEKGKKSISYSEENKLKEEPMDVDDVPTTMRKKKSEDTMRRLVEDVNIADMTFLGDRHALAFSQENVSSTPHEELPDEFFELTIQDARKIFNDLKKKREDLENIPLQTEAFKKLEQSKKVLRQINQYKSSVIRINFPDRTVLQGTFKPVETIEKVMDFVKNYLHDKDMHFYLYTTPPKNVLEPTKTLADYECVPCAILYFGTDKSVPDTYKYLRGDLFQRFISPSIASIAASKLIIKNPRALQMNDEKVNEKSNANDINAGASTSKSVPRSEESVPKWFKIKK